jgi:hypothetical protein
MAWKAARVMTKTWFPGQNRGFIFIDVLSALLIAGTALLIVLGSIALAARTARRVTDRAVQLVTARNEHAEKQKVLFTKKLLPD